MPRRGPSRTTQRPSTRATFGSTTGAGVKVTVSQAEYRDVMRALKRADRDTRRQMLKVIRDTGEPVRKGAARRFRPVDYRSAAGFRVRVRAAGVTVDQKLRRTTGKHPGYGRMQMRRALLPSLAENRDEMLRRMRRAIDQINLRFNTGR